MTSRLASAPMPPAKLPRTGPVGEGGALQHPPRGSRRHVVAGQVGIVLDGHGRVVFLPRGVGICVRAAASRHAPGVLAHERADDEHLLATVERLAGRLEGVSPAARGRARVVRRARCRGGA